jgi:hypothetical protein
MTTDYQRISLIMLPQSFYTTCFKEFPMHEWISWVKEQEWKISMNSSFDPRFLATFPIWIGFELAFVDSSIHGNLAFYDYLVYKMVKICVLWTS